MAYVVRRKGGWEIRESRSTPRGPRSRTLATFKELTPEVLERARGQSTDPLDVAAVRAAAVRAGAPVLTDDTDRWATSLVHDLASGRRPRRGLALALRELLAAAEDRPSDAVQSEAAWIGASALERGAALRELLLLTDSLPARRRHGPLRFPRFGPAQG